MMVAEELGTCNFRTAKNFYERGFPQQELLPIREVLEVEMIAARKIIEQEREKTREGLVADFASSEALTKEKARLDAIEARAKEGILVREARDRLKGAGVPTNHLLLRALPLTAEVRQFMASHDVVYLMEQNRDGQMATIFKDEFPEFATSIVSVLIYDGLPATAGEIVRQIDEHREGTTEELGPKVDESWQQKQIASI